MPGGGRSLTGAIPLIVAYKLASVMHADLAAIYRKFLTAPIEIYTEETVESRAEALTRMVVTLSEKIHE